LLDIVGSLEYLVIEWNNPDLHFRQFTTKKFDSIKEVPKVVQRCMRLALRHDTSQLVFFDLWRELGQAVRELMCSNYDSVPRSLRWMIEACVLWADMQLDDITAKEHFENYYSQKDKLSQREFNRVFLEIHSVSEGMLEERLVLKEKYRNLNVKEIIDKLPILNLSISKDRSLKNENLYIKKELMKHYSEFSKFAHFTLDTAKEIALEPGELHWDFAFFQDFRYDKEMFHYELENIYSALDLILALMVLVLAKFIGYETPNRFFGCLGACGKEAHRKIKKMPDYFPFTKGMMGEA